MNKSCRKNGKDRFIVGGSLGEPAEINRMRGCFVAAESWQLIVKIGLTFDESSAQAMRFGA